MLKKLVLLLILSLGLNTAFAYKINNVEVVRYGERYLITFDAYLDASVTSVEKVIYDFENAASLTPAVLRTEVYRYDEDTARVTATMRPCVFIFCRTMEKLTIVNLEKDRIHLKGVEDAGDFRNTNEVIKFHAEDRGTLLHYKGDLSPAFFMPQWLGVRFIRGTVRKYLGGMLAAIESRANTDA